MNMQLDTLAKVIYDVMVYDGQGEKPAWVEGGNSDKQQEARRYANAIMDHLNKVIHEMEANYD